MTKCDHVVGECWSSGDPYDHHRGGGVQYSPMTWSQMQKRGPLLPGNVVKYCVNCGADLRRLLYDFNKEWQRAHPKQIVADWQREDEIRWAEQWKTFLGDA